jgi:hypothetical protein
LDMLPMQARFASQNQAESAMRKLASLRSDCFRLERAGHDNEAVDPSMVTYPSIMSMTSTELENTSSPTVDEFTLSANVPGAVAEQARSVIMQAGGQVI